MSRFYISINAPEGTDEVQWMIYLMSVVSQVESSFPELKVMLEEKQI